MEIETIESFFKKHNAPGKQARAGFDKEFISGGDEFLNRFWNNGDAKFVRR